MKKLIKEYVLTFLISLVQVITIQTTRPVQSVASANRSVKPGRQTVKLTPSQVAIAKKLGVPLEDYAKTIKTHEGGIAYEQRNENNFSCEPNTVKD